MPQNLFIIWSPKWELGVNIIDEQHKGVAALINTLFFFIRTNNISAENLIYIMMAMNKFSMMHSITETQLLLRSAYPKAQEHIEMHKNLHNEMQKHMRNSLKTGDHHPAPYIFMDFLKRWWVDHLCSYDKEYIQHLLNYLQNQPYEKDHKNTANNIKKEYLIDTIIEDENI